MVMEEMVTVEVADLLSRYEGLHAYATPLALQDIFHGLTNDMNHDGIDNEGFIDNLILAAGLARVRRVEEGCVYVTGLCEGRGSLRGAEAVDSKDKDDGDENDEETRDCIFHNIEGVFTVIDNILGRRWCNRGVHAHH